MLIQHAGPGEYYRIFDDAGRSLGVVASIRNSEQSGYFATRNDRSRLPETYGGVQEAAAALESARA